MQMLKLNMYIIESSNELADNFQRITELLLYTFDRCVDPNVKILPKVLTYIYIVKYDWNMF